MELCWTRGEQPSDVVDAGPENVGVISWTALTKIRGKSWRQNPVQDYRRDLCPIMGQKPLRTKK